MGGKSDLRTRLAALVLSCAGAAAVALPAQVHAQVRVGIAVESPADALARHVKVLAGSPRDFESLIGAGKAALALGDGQAAAGFFGRAEEVWPANPQPQIGIAASLAQEGDASAAMQYFARAAQLGATQSMLGVERGLAYDLLGQHTLAQADYRAALATPADADEARRRLALSLAITGNRADALAMLGPLMARGDAAGARCRALVLALSGDRAGARAAIEAAMPGSSASMDYFFHRLPTLRSDQKAAAVHLGMFPDSAQLASAQPSYGGGYGQPVAEDRLSSIEQLLSRGAPAASQPPIAAPAQPTQRVASVTRRTTARTSATRSASEPAGSTQSKLWLQLASGSDARALPQEFSRMKSRNRELFRGIDGYVAEEPGRARLLIGPFRNREEASIFAEDLATVSIDAFSWTNRTGQVVRKLSSE